MTMRAISSLLKNKAVMLPGLVLGMTGFVVHHAMAQETVHQLVEQIEHVEHESGGLPQFDPSSFSSQIFWLVVVFAVLYGIFSRASLPRIAGVINARDAKISEDRNAAEIMANEANTVMEAYEKSLTDARDQSAAISAEATQTIKTRAEQALSSFQKKAEERMAAMDEGLNNSKIQAMDDMNNIAAEIASSAAEKIVGLSTDLNQAKTVVQSLNKLSKAA